MAGKIHLKKPHVFLTLDESSDLWFDADPQEQSELSTYTGPIENPPLEMPQQWEGAPEGSLWWHTPAFRKMMQERKGVQFPFMKSVCQSGEYRMAKNGRLYCVEPEVLVLMTPDEVRDDLKDIGEFASNVFISGNMKTFLSFNQRIAKTSNVRKDMNQIYGPEIAKLMPDVEGSCMPTAWCSKSCYAKAGHLAFSDKQRRMLANLLHMEGIKSASEAKVNESVDEVYKYCIKKFFGVNKKLNILTRPNMRLFGSGDMTPGAVRWINAFAERHPDFILWGMTRRVDLLKKIVPRENVVFQVSVDPSTPYDGGIVRTWTAKRGEFRANPFRVEDFRDELMKRGFNYCYATHLQNDPMLPALRERGWPIMTTFGYHGYGVVTAANDFYECPATNPAISDFYAKVNWGDWFRRGPIGGEKNLFICQVCRWCMTPPIKMYDEPQRVNGGWRAGKLLPRKMWRTREQILGKQRPMETLYDPYFAAAPLPQEISTYAAQVMDPTQRPLWLKNPPDPESLVEQAVADQMRMPSFFRGQ